MTKEEQLRILLSELANSDNAPIEYNNEEASAWACGYADLKEQIMNILNQNDN